MSLERFLHDLHFDIDKVRSTDQEVDWDNAPLAYKLYRSLPEVQLSSELPLSLEEIKIEISPTLREISHFLWYVYGITKICQSFYALNNTESTVSLTQIYRRFLPSGGALYPSECYVYLKIRDLPTGVYHYNVAHHSLVLLREGNFDTYLDRTLGNRCEVSRCFGAVFVSTVFWKNFFKYNNFAYRLQGLDAGILIGQLLEVSKRFGFESTVYFQFLDQAVNHLLGLSAKEESVYAIIPLSVESQTNWFADGNDKDEIIHATDLCQELESTSHEYYFRSMRTTEYPMLLQMNEASMQNSTQSFRLLERGKNRNEGQPITLPHVDRLSYDLTSACQKRYSPGIDFILGKISKLQLNTLLQESTTAFCYRNDLDGIQGFNPRVTIVGCLYNVENIPDGTYNYDSVGHTLRLEQFGDHRQVLQQGMSYHNINLFQVPLCFYVIGDRNHLTTALGYRGYRIQQMETGMLVQRLLLVASALGLGGHPLLGFDSQLSDKLFKVASQGKTSLIQIPIGPYGPRSRLEGNLSC